MTQQHADILAAKFISELESEDYKIVRIMSFFDSKTDNQEALRLLHGASLRDVYLNYQTLSDFRRQVTDEHLHVKASGWKHN